MKKREVLWAVLCKSPIHSTLPLQFFARSVGECILILACGIDHVATLALELEEEEEEEGEKKKEITLESLRKKADNYLPSIGVPSTDLTDPIISYVLLLPCARSSLGS